MGFVEDIRAFVSALAKASRASDNTVKGYQRDLEDFTRFLTERGRSTVGKNGAIIAASITADHVRDYLARVMDRSSRATAQRRLFAIKAFYRWRETSTGEASPVRSLKSIKLAKRLPQVISEAAVADLIDGGAATASLAAELRNRAILEVLYAGGLRVSEERTHRTMLA
jgi:integrase/recombinase XerD